MSSSPFQGQPGALQGSVVFVLRFLRLQGRKYTWALGSSMFGFIEVAASVLFLIPPFSTNGHQVAIHLNSHFRLRPRRRLRPAARTARARQSDLCLGLEWGFPA